MKNAHYHALHRKSLTYLIALGLNPKDFTIIAIIWKVLIPSWCARLISKFIIPRIIFCERDKCFAAVFE